MQKPPLIAPSVLSADFGCLSQEINLLEQAGADIIHLDVMDGHYVPNMSFGFPVIARVRQITNLPLDAHLMVTNPAVYVDRLAQIGVQMISFHQECEHHSHRLIRHIRSLGIKAGLALNPGTPLHTIECLLPELDFVLLMSVNPGFSGQSFIPAVLDKTRSLQAMIASVRPDILIEVDGGVSNANSGDLTQAGADILVSASYIFSSADYKSAISALRGLPQPQ